MKKLLLLTTALLTMLLSSCGSNGGNDEWYDLSLIPIVQGDQMGYIDWNGKYVIMPQFKEALSFSKNGLARVMDHNGLYGFIDKKGKYVIPAAYAEASIFSEDIAFVTPSGEHIQAIDSKGKVLFTCQKAQIIRYFSDGLAVYVNSEGKYGAIDKTGSDIIPATYTYIGDFSEGLAIFQDDSNKIGYIDKEGGYIINPQFDWAIDFHEGLAVVVSGEKYGFIDKKGNYVIPPQFDRADSFSEGLALVFQGNSFGYIDKKGNYVINPQFDWAYPFRGGVAIVEPSGSDLWGLIDKKGNYTINPQFKEIIATYKDKIAVSNGSKSGITDRKGKYIVTPQLEQLKIPFTYNEYGVVPTVSSQYFNTTEIVYNLNNVIGNNPYSVGEINQESTLGDLREEDTWNLQSIYTEPNALLKGEEVTLGNDVTLRYFKIVFDEAITNDENNFNDNAHVRQVILKIEFSFEAIDHLDLIKSTIIKHLSSRYQLVEEKVISSEIRDIVFQCDDNDIEITLTFTFPISKSKANMLAAEEATQPDSEEVDD